MNIFVSIREIFYPCKLICGRVFKSMQVFGWFLVSK